MDFYGNKFLINDKILGVDEFKKQYVFEYKNVYEVVRILNGEILFWDEHFNRLKNSIFLLTGKNINLSEIEFKIKNISNLNNILNGNIKIEIFFHESGEFDLCIYPINFYYPDGNIGVDVITYNIERINPKVKTYDISFKDRVNKLIKENDVYEIIMVNKNGFVTEGSRTNVYFVKDKYFFTASEEVVLSGVTRKKVNNIIKQLGFKLVEESVHIENIFDFECCFLTSTSSNVLPVKKINGKHINFNNNNLKKVQQFFNEYFQK